MANKNVRSSTQKFTEIKDIQENVVYFVNNTACLIIEVNATNFVLLSQEEQQTKIYSYAALLNSLSFPIQIFIRNKRVDITSYLKSLEAEIQKTQNQLLKNHISLYKDFIQELVKVMTVLDKKFYIVIPYSYLEGGAASAVKKGGTREDFSVTAKNSLHSKEAAILGQVARLNLSAKTLEKEELIKLFYEIYNGEVVSSQITSDVKTPIVKSEEDKVVQSQTNGTSGGIKV